MTWLWLVLAGWLPLSAAAALLVGRGVRLADQRGRVEAGRSSSASLGGPARIGR